MFTTSYQEKKHFRMCLYSFGHRHNQHVSVSPFLVREEVVPLFQSAFIVLNESTFEPNVD